MKLRSSLLGTVKTAFAGFGEDEAMTRAAAVAYYTALSMAPLVVLLLWGSSLLGEDVQQAWIDQIQSLVGAQGGKAVEMIVENAESRPTLGTIAGIVSIATLAFAATAVFAELQGSLNKIWRVEPKKGSSGVKTWIRKRIASFGMLLSIFFLLLVSTALSAVVDAAAGRLIGESESIAIQAVHFVVSLGVFTASFALLYRYLPDAKIGWRDVWFGGAVTALLFAVGKFAIGLYLGRGSIGSAYGTAGSLIVLLAWAYYSAIIFFVGAEITRAWIVTQGRHIHPEPHAQRIDPVIPSPDRKPRPA